jgi:molybdate transport system substrate-binding protein
MRFNKLFSLSGVLTIGLLCSSAHEDSLLVAAAADLGNEVKVSLGSSGNFHAQIQNGAPFQVYMSADEKYPRDLIAKGFAITDSYVVYGTGRIALWTLKPEFNIKQGLTALTDASVTRVAIANPAHAPYGRAAEAALNKYGIWNQIQPKLVLGENIAQTAQFVQSGNVDAGIVAVSLLSSPKLKGVGRWVEVPGNLYPPLVQAAVVTRAGASSKLARQYVAYLGSSEARVILQRFGFVAPQ